MSDNLEITLKKGEIKEDNSGLNILSYPIYIEAYSNLNLENSDIQPNPDGLYPCNVFVYQMNGTGLDPNQGDRFMKVATAIDIDGYPSYDISIDQDTPITSVKGFPFFRYNKVKLFVDNVEELNDIWTYIKQDIKYLVDDYNRLKNLTASEDSTIL